MASFIVVTTVRQRDITGASAFVISASSKAEADGLILKRMKMQNPEDQGCYDYRVCATELYQEYLLELVIHARTKSEIEQK